jgi:hypothetical protein
VRCLVPCWENHVCPVCVPALKEEDRRKDVIVVKCFGVGPVFVGKVT